MKLRYYQIDIRYKNKMHDFHGWGVAVQICYFGLHYREFTIENSNFYY